MTEKKFPEPIEALVVILITFGFIFAVTFIITLMAFLLKTDSILEGNTSYLFIVGGLIFLAVPVFYVKIKNYNYREIFRLNVPPGEVMLLAAPIGVSLAVLTDELDRVMQMFIPPPESFLTYMESLRAETTGDWIMLIFGVVIIAALSEEILFRGFLQVSLERKGDITRAVLLSSVSWTVIHINPYWAIQIFITGVIIGFLAWRTDSVYPSMVVHATNNLLSLIVINLDPEASMEWYNWGNHVSPVLLIIAAVVLVLSIRRVSHFYTQSYDKYEKIV